MFEFISGKLIEKNPSYVIIECNSIGYYINISLNTFSHIKNKDSCRLLTHFVVREDAQILFGFSEESERIVFRQLISVSGVGANTARMILSSMPPSEIASAIVNGQLAILQKIKGIGTKTAQRIIIDLKDKMLKADIQSENLSIEYNRSKEDALIALVTLGFSKVQANKSLEKVFLALGDVDDVEEIVKQALKTLN